MMTRMGKKASGPQPQRQARESVSEVEFTAMMKIFWSAFAVVLVSTVACKGEDYPHPFSRELRVEAPPLRGDDVVIAQHLLQRANSQSCKNLTMSGEYDVVGSIVCFW